MPPDDGGFSELTLDQKIENVVSSNNTRLDTTPLDCSVFREAVTRHGATLRRVEFSHAVTDDDLDFLAKHAPGVQEIGILDGTRVSDNGMKSIGKLSKLMRVEIYKSRRMTNAGLGYLRPLSQLQEVGVYLCAQVNEVGIAAFKRAMPLCKVRT